MLGISGEMESEYLPLEPLGEGSTLRKVCRRSTGEVFAMKKMMMTGDAARHMGPHPNVLHVHDALYLEGAATYVLMEYMDLGDLGQRLPFNERQASVSSRHVVEGLLHLQREGRTHRDLTASNILLNSRGEIKVSGNVGVSDHLRAHFRRFDVWSLGILLIEFLSGFPPESDEVLTIPESVECSTACRDFVSLCTRKNPIERPSLSDLLHHEFITGNMKLEVCDVFTLLNSSEWLHHMSPTRTLNELGEHMCQKVLEDAIIGTIRKNRNRGGENVSRFLASMHEAESLCPGFAKEFLMQFLHFPPQNRRCSPLPETLSLSPDVFSAVLSSKPIESLNDSTGCTSSNVISITSLPPMPEVSQYVDPVAALYNRWRRNVKAEEQRAMLANESFF